MLSLASVAALGFLGTFSDTFRRHEQKAQTIGSRDEEIERGSAQLAAIRTRMKSDPRSFLQDIASRANADRPYPVILEAALGAEGDPDTINAVRPALRMATRGEFNDPVAFAHMTVCKAAVAAVMGKLPSAVKVDRYESGTTFTFYRHPSDSSLWRQKCKLDGARVIWGDANGRWQDEPGDELLMFGWSEDSLIVRQSFADGSQTSRAFAWSDFLY